MRFARLDACGADPELVALCKRCLAADRDARPRDAEEVARSVTDHLAAAEERARRAELDRVRAEESRKRQGVQALLVGSVLVLLLVAFIGVLLAISWKQAERDRVEAVEAGTREENARHEAEVATASQKTLRHYSEVAPTARSEHGVRRKRHAKRWNVSSTAGRCR